jgi:hypothetical protein
MGINWWTQTEGVVQTHVMYGRFSIPVARFYVTTLVRMVGLAPTKLYLLRVVGVLFPIMPHTQNGAQHKNCTCRLSLTKTAFRYQNLMGKLGAGPGYAPSRSGL